MGMTRRSAASLAAEEDDADIIPNGQICENERDDRELGNAIIDGGRKQNRRLELMIMALESIMLLFMSMMVLVGTVDM